MSGQYFPYVLGYKHATWPVQRAAKSRDGANPIKTGPSSEWQAETRLHEVGIASNGESAHHREYVLRSCTHRPSNHGSQEHPKYTQQECPKVNLVTGVKS